GGRRARLRVHAPPRRRRAVRPGQLLQHGRGRARGGRVGRVRAARAHLRSAGDGRGARHAPAVGGARLQADRLTVQNVHAMRPEVRAEYERLRGRIDGDAAFGVRFDRSFTELRDPLFALYGTDERFPAQWAALLDAIARTAAQRPEALRVLEHEREMTADWLHREQAVGYVAYTDRFGGTLQGVRERLGYLRELGVGHLPLMPVPHAPSAPCT